MYVSPRPIRLPVHDVPPLRRDLFPLLAFALYVLLAITGTLLLGARAGTAFQCGEASAACIGP